MYNLTTNTDFGSSNDLWSSLISLRKMTSRISDITCFLASSKVKVSFFYGHQVAEERIKAHLLELGGEWPDRIYRAEQHHYFKGQIGFILRFCGINLDKPDKEIERINVKIANALMPEFDRYFACAAQMIEDIEDDEKGKGRLWARALLAVGNYLRNVRRNYCLLNSGTDRDSSWKRLLRDAAVVRDADEELDQGSILMKLYDRLVPFATYKSKLDNIIENEEITDPWRKAIVDTPDVYDYGEYNMLRWHNNNGIYVLRKYQMNGYHCELFTYCVYKELVKVGAEPLSLIIEDYRETNSTDSEPGLSLKLRFGTNDVTFHLERPRYSRDRDEYDLYLNEPREPESDLREILEKAGFDYYEDDEGVKRLTNKLNRAGIKDAVLTLDRLLAR